MSKRRDEFLDDLPFFLTPQRDFIEAELLEHTPLLDQIVDELGDVLERVDEITDEGPITVARRSPLIDLHLTDAGRRRRR